jgi:hypothetical protein
MGERTSYTHGTFCWTDLSTTDPEAAKAFYCGLFGWEYEDMPAGEGMTYTMLRQNGNFVAALAEVMQPGQPAAWMSYVSVDNVDATSARALELGASALMEPFDVLEAGRMAILQDPTGAVFALWQPKDMIGAQFVNAPGALCLNQLGTPDVEAAQRFYSDLFGWRVESVGSDDNPYWGLYNGESLNGGMMPLPPGDPSPPHWLSYFGSEDVDADARRVGELGGQILLEPMDVPGGRIVVASDPQGAVFGLFAGRFDD